MRQHRDPDQVFKQAMEHNGAEILRPTNPYEVMRFRTAYGVGIVYENKRGVRRWNEPAEQARAHLRERKGWLAPTRPPKRVRDPGLMGEIIERDGDECFYCGQPVPEAERTKEHLVPTIHGGPTNLANLFLAHNRCNSGAGTLSAAQKVALRDQMRAAPQAPPVATATPQSRRAWPFHFARRAEHG